MTDKNHLRTTLICLVLALATALLYFPALGFDFINFDDQNYLLNNVHVNRGWKWRELAWCFQAGACNNWHPMTWMSHMLDCQFFGLRPAGHHAVNVLLHVLNSVLVFLVFRSVTGALWRSAVVAALFAWHPLHVESVAWVSERKDVLSTFFGLLALWAYSRYVREAAKQSDGGRPFVGRSAIFYGVSILLFALGLMAKPMLVTLPFVLLLLDWWPLGRFGANLQTAQGHPRAARSKPTALPERSLALLIEKIPFFVLSTISCVLTYIAQNTTGAVLALANLPLSARLANATVAYLRYVEKLIWPVNLAISYPLDNPLPVWLVAAAAFFLIAVTFAAAWSRKRYPCVLMGWLWYLGTLVPVIGLVQVGGQAMADRYSYIPSIGLFAATCWGIYDILHSWRYSQFALVALTTFVLSAFASQAGRQLQYWRDGGTVFLRALAVTPNNYIAHATYGSFLLNQHHLKQARAECEMAVKLRPDYPSGRLFLGNTLYLQGDLEDAAREMAVVRQIDPHSSDACRLLGEILMARKLPAEAAGQFGAELQLDPGNPGAHCRLGKALAAQGKLDGARAEFREAIGLVFEYPDAHYQLALALETQRKTAEAISHYRTALKFKPNYPEALNNLAWILAADSAAQNRDGPEAVELAARACKITAEKEPLLLGTLAAAYAEAGQFDKAVATAQKAHDLAKTQGNENLAARNLELRDIYRNHRAYHER